MLAAAGDLLTLFLGLETMSLGVYALTGFRRGRAAAPKRRSSTSCSARSRPRCCSTAARSLYGATGHTDFAGIGQRIASAGAVKTAAQAVRCRSSSSADARSWSASPSR